MAVDNNVATRPSTTTTQTTQTTTVQTTEPAVGGGTVAQTGPVPQVTGQALMGAMMASLRDLMPDIGGEKLQVALLEVMSKMKDAISETEKGKIEVDQQAKRSALQAKQEKIEEAEKKQAQAAEKRESLSVWDKIKIAFQYIGAIAAIIAGALALATSWLTGPAGIVSGVLLIGAGVILLGMAADATYVAATGDGKTGLGFIGEIHKAVLMNEKGMSEEEATTEAHKADTIARIVATAVAGAMMLGAAIAGGVSAFQLGFAVMRFVQGGAGIATNVTAGASTVASATGDTVQAVGQRDATNLDADAKDALGESKAFEGVIKYLEDMIDLVMTRLNGTHEGFESNLDALLSSVRDSGETYARVGVLRD